MYKLIYNDAQKTGIYFLCFLFDHFVYKSCVPFLVKCFGNIFFYNIYFLVFIFYIIGFFFFGISLFVNYYSRNVIKIILQRMLEGIRTYFETYKVIKFLFQSLLIFNHASTPLYRYRCLGFEIHWIVKCWEMTIVAIILYILFPSLDYF